MKTELQDALTETLMESKGFPKNELPTIARQARQWAIVVPLIWFTIGLIGLCATWNSAATLWTDEVRETWKNNEICAPAVYHMIACVGVVFFGVFALVNATDRDFWQALLMPKLFILNFIKNQ